MRRADRQCRKKRNKPEPAAGGALRVAFPCAGARRHPTLTACSRVAWNVICGQRSCVSFRFTPEVAR